MTAPLTPGAPRRAPGLRALGTMIGGRRPISGRKPGDKRIRVERHHSPYFRYTGPHQLTAKAAANAPTTTMGRFNMRLKRRAPRPAARQRGGDRRAAVQEEGARDLQLGRHLVVRVRDRGDHPGLHPRGRRRRRVPPLDRGQRRDRAPAGDRRLQLPPGVHRLPQRRRLVLGVQGELRPAGLAGRGVRAADRLHAHRRRVHLLGRRADRVGRPGAPRLEGAHRDHGDRPDHAGQPARPARGRQHLRHPHLPVPGQRLPHDRRWACSGSWSRATRVRRPARGRQGAARRPTENVGILILLRAFASGAVALTGTEAIATGVPAFQPAGGPERRPHADGDGDHPGHPVHRHHVPGHELPHPAVDPTRR